MGRRLVPEGRRSVADRIGRLVYNVVGRYIAGTLFMAALAGVVVLVAVTVARRSARRAVARGVGRDLQPDAAGRRLPRRGPVRRARSQRRAPVTGVICLIVFLIYQQLENHVLQPLIIGRAVRARHFSVARWWPRSSVSRRAAWSAACSRSRCSARRRPSTSPCAPPSSRSQYARLGATHRTPPRVGERAATR